MARKSLCEASIASLGDIYKKCTDLVQQPCSQIPAVIWEVQSQFTYWNLADRFRDFKAFCIFGDFNYSSNQCNNPVLRVLCPFVVYFPYLRDRSIWAKRSNPNIYIYFPLFPPNSAIHSKGDGWDLQGHPLQRVQGHHWQGRIILGGFGRAVRSFGEQFDLFTFYGNNWVPTSTLGSFPILWKRLGCNFSPRFLLVCRKCAIWIPANYTSKIIDDIPFFLYWDPYIGILIYM